MLKEPTNVTCVLEKEDVDKIENIDKLHLTPLSSTTYESLHSS